MESILEAIGWMVESGCLGARWIPPLAVCFAAHVLARFA